ncbi:MAG: SIMPL domain-containing protein [Nitrosopumilaceae archaeon]
MAIVALGLTAFLAFGNSFQSAFSQEYAALSSKPTIKVTGDASLMLKPDQAVIVITKQSMPTDLNAALKDQDEGMEKIITAIKNATSEDNQTTVTPGSMSLNPYFSGQSYSDIGIFTIYASTSVGTDLGHFSDIVKKLSEAEFTFESVYASPYMSPIYGGVYAAASQSEVLVEGDPEAGATEDQSDQITINVAINTKPDSLNNVLDEYEKKYTMLLQLLEEIGVSSDKIKPANVSINPYYYGPGQTASYQTYSQVIVKTNTANIEKISDLVRKEGAYVESTFISVSDNSIEKARDELNQKAFDNARSRAEAMAKLAGLNVGGIVKIESTNNVINPYSGVSSYKGLYVIPPYYYQSMNGEIATSVTVEFELTK